MKSFIYSLITLIAIALVLYVLNQDGSPSKTFPKIPNEVATVNEAASILVDSNKVANPENNYIDLDTMITSLEQETEESYMYPTLQEGLLERERQMWRDVRTETVERMKNPDTPQSVYGAIRLPNLPEGIDQEVKIVAVGDEWSREPQMFSRSVRLDNSHYHFGILKPGKYKINTSPTDHLPSIIVPEFVVEPNQSAQVLDLEYGNSMLRLEVFNHEGEPVESNKIEIIMGGASTSDETYTWQSTNKIVNGTWKAKYLYPNMWYVLIIRFEERSLSEVFYLPTEGTKVIASFKDDRLTFEKGIRLYAP